MPSHDHKGQRTDEKKKKIKQYNNKDDNNNKRQLEVDIGKCGHEFFLFFIFTREWERVKGLSSRHI